MVFDFDGTLAAIVDEPASARPREGVVEHLAALADVYRLVGVISGRPVQFLAGTLPHAVYLSGLYGMEEWSGDRVVVADEFRQWADAMTWATRDVQAAAAAGGPLSGVEVEDKGLSLTLHYRGRPELADAVVAAARSVAEARGLDVRPARMSVEVHPPVPTDKGHVLRQLVVRHRPDAVLFVGDDVGDLPAFGELARLRAQGLTTLAVAVASEEMDPRVRAEADLVIGEAQVVELLTILRDGVDAGAGSAP